jgi:CxxC-x17-CxxC domain-containing protein
MRSTLKAGPTISLSELGKGKLAKDSAARKEADKSSKNKKATEKEKPKFDAKCVTCGKDFKIGFDPDPSKPIYCDDCFEKIKEERRKKPEERGLPTVKMLDDLVPKEEVLSAKPISLNDALSQGVTGFDGKVRQPQMPQKNDEGLTEEEYKLEWYEQAKKLVQENSNNQPDQAQPPVPPTSPMI